VAFFPPTIDSKFKNRLKVRHQLFGSFLIRMGYKGALTQVALALRSFFGKKVARQTFESFQFTGSGLSQPFPCASISLNLRHN
jgi:hypothetical protein